MPEPAATDNAHCPRCGGSFYCGVREGMRCACGQYRLSAETTRMLRQQYQRCVCLNCLAQLQDAPTDEKRPALP